MSQSQFKPLLTPQEIAQLQMRCYTITPTQGETGYGETAYTVGPSSTFDVKKFAALIEQEVRNKLLIKAIGRLKEEDDIK